LSGHSGLDYNHLITKLENLGYKKGNINDPFVNFVFIELENMKYDKKAFYIKSDIKSLIDNKDNLIDKRKLYLNMNEEIRNKYFAKTIDAKDFKYENFPVILRPIGGFAGKDIFIPESKLEFISCLEKLKKYKEVIVSDYIQNPMLFENKKFHIRILFMIKVGFKSSFSIFKRGLIRTAEENYKNSNYENKKIHDTHAKSTIRQLYYPEDYPGEYIQDQIEEVLTFASKTISPKNFPETKKGFEVFGADILVTEENKIILMEVNDKVGGMVPITKEPFDVNLGPWSESYSKFSNDYYQWTLDSIFT